MDIQFDIKPLEILKWIGLVFVAGFVGYFGRYLSMLLIDRVRKKKNEAIPVTGGVGEVATAESDKSENDRIKIEKKRLKLEKKKVKKATGQKE